MTKKRYGYYSAKAAEEFGSVFYKNPEGMEVRITIVDSSPNLSEINYSWDDTVSVGEVTEFIGLDALAMQIAEMDDAMDSLREHDYNDDQDYPDEIELEQNDPIDDEEIEQDEPALSPDFLEDDDDEEDEFWSESNWN
jgi:hypothetical protein